MSKSYRGWAELEDWPHRVARRQHKRKAEQDWKREVEEEMSETTTTVYKVINAWTPVGLDVELTEETYASFTEQNAWDVLWALADDRGIQLNLRENSFANPNPDSATDNELWYIETTEVNP